jgi:hypothetical protein
MPELPVLRLSDRRSGFSEGRGFLGSGTKLWFSGLVEDEDEVLVDLDNRPGQSLYRS